ncbi:hypothetical protein BFP97_02115 [Roseivirga sp. 4D4]|uniref:sensor histidine kinase n=1 Tax=Roseivirga sp. 4D4 TaxID=1889784 RepID=UPI000852DD8D|nr:histidine kinase [Roseivirga sp. 4D4]OEK00380.1 hypothetical protein BFP97_02115 [Roseivirga sp. 4D4]
MKISKHYIKWLHIGFWLILFLFPFTFGIQEEPLIPVLTRISLPFALQIGLAYFNLYVLVPKLFKRKKYGQYGLSVLVLLVGVSRMLIWWFRSNLTEAQLSRTIPGSEFTFADLPQPVQIFPPLILTLIILFISTVYALAIDQSKKEQVTILLEKEKTEAELKFLRSQINPHFFFNALNNLYSVFKLKPEKTDQFIQKLSEMLRYVTYECQNGQIKLSREIEVIESYIFFQSMKDEANIEVKLKKEIDNPLAEIEPMILIPLLENAFKHGYSITGENLDINIDIQHRGHNTSIHIENSFIPSASQPNKAPSETGIGLSNIQHRLNYAYPDRHKFESVQKNGRFIINININHDAV